MIRSLVWVGLLFTSQTGFAADASTVTQCHGTEPFWSLTIAADKLEFKSADETGLQMTIANTGARSAAARSAQFISLYQGRTQQNSARFMNVMIKKDAGCSDGMSDETYPASVLVLSGTTLFEGCCK